MAGRDQDMRCFISQDDAGAASPHRYGSKDYKPVVWLERPVPLYERIALYSMADVAVITATRDGMNLVPYKYITCREGAVSSSAPSPFPHTPSRGAAATPLLWQHCCCRVWCFLTSVIVHLAVKLSMRFNC